MTAKIEDSKEIKSCFSQDMLFIVTYQDWLVLESWKKSIDPHKEIKLLGSSTPHTKLANKLTTITI